MVGKVNRLRGIDLGIELTVAEADDAERLCETIDMVNFVFGKIHATDLRRKLILYGAVVAFAWGVAGVVRMPVCAAMLSTFAVFSLANHMRFRQTAGSVIASVDERCDTDGGFSGLLDGAPATVKTAVRVLALKGQWPNLPSRIFNGSWPE